jgi:hypothetical protein
MEKLYKHKTCEFCKADFFVDDAPSHANRRKYCSRKCSNSANAIKKSSGLSRPEYERNYWAKQENKDRQRVSKECNRLKRMEGLGEPYVRAMLARCKTRAKRKNMDFDLMPEDIMIPIVCPVLGIPLEYVQGKGGSWNSPSLDRIDNDKGYIKGNVQIISKRANSIKSDASFDEIEKVYLFLRDKTL